MPSATRYNIRQACGLEEELSDDLFLKSADRLYLWIPTVTKGFYFSNSFKKMAVEASTAKDLAEKRIPDLIDSILKVHDDLTPFFYQERIGHPRLQFFLMDPRTFGRPSFRRGLTITDSPSIPPDRGEDGLLNIRRAYSFSNKKPFHIYPGLIYRLISTGRRSSSWSLGRTVYTDLIESCDYLAFRIKSGWQTAMSKGEAAVTKFLKTDPAVLEWRDLIKQILVGDFSHYLAGLAFSSPIFQVVDKGQHIKLLMGLGSSAKQANYGMHVAPAGMLEFAQGDDDNSLTLKNFQTILAKELIEETLVGKNFEAVKDNYKRKFSVMEAAISVDGVPFPQNFGGYPFQTNLVRLIIEDDILPHWDNYWVKTPPSKTLLQKALSFNPDQQPSFWIVDSFTLRPEIITPIFVTEDLPNMLSWEYEETQKETKQFNNMDEVRNYVAETRSSWAAPGLAAMYLGAKHFFGE
ncbi:MAG: hypothetical protein LBI10_01105 [Deltaproteobacteria bacterium]|jgi:hypothetical protein|nr:hypothetical protein [Deltaproteobacteria bacterium]